MDAAADARQFRHFVFHAPPCKRPLEMMALGPWFLVPNPRPSTRGERPERERERHTHQS
jgi:hypothetical protein